MTALPSIANYLESLHDSRLSFATLRVEPQLDARGELYAVAGNFSVVFKVGIEGQMYALKCFLRENPVREARYRALERWLAECHETIPVPTPRYLCDEIAVFSNFDCEMRMPVVITPWVEGETLGEYVRRKQQQRDSVALQRLVPTFCDFARRLIESPFAHGDLKPDNLLVTPDEQLVLIDLDGVYIPDFAGENASENGTPDFQHPRRDRFCFDRHIDDYSLALLLFNLIVTANDPDPLTEPFSYTSRYFQDSRLRATIESIFDRLLGRNNYFEAYLVKSLFSELPEVENLTAILQKIPTSENIVSETPLTLFRKQGKWGCSQTDGRWVLPPLFDDIEINPRSVTIKIGRLLNIIPTHPCEKD